MVRILAKYKPRHLGYRDVGEITTFAPTLSIRVQGTHVTKQDMEEAHYKAKPNEVTKPPKEVGL